MSDPGAMPGWIPVWADEFDRDGPPDPALWRYLVRPPWVVEQIGLIERNHFGPPQLGNARVQGGCLEIEARKESIPGLEYSSACLASVPLLTGGRVRVRAQLPTGRGAWPAIWLLPPNGELTGWPRCGEIDLVEHFGAITDKIHVNVNTQTANIADGTAPSTWLRVPTLAAGFHVYGLDWSADRLELSFDERVVLTYSKLSDDVAQWPFGVPFELRLQLALGGLREFGADVDETRLPQRLLIDYVRVYRRG